MGRKDGTTPDTIEEHSYADSCIYTIDDPRRNRSGSKNALALISLKRGKASGSNKIV